MSLSYLESGDVELFAVLAGNTYQLFRVHRDKLCEVLEVFRGIFAVAGLHNEVVEISDAAANLVALLPEATYD